MKQKNRANIFTISFKPDVPRHALAMDALNTLGRRKADFLSRLIEAAARNPEAFQMVLSSGVPPIEPGMADKLSSLYKDRPNYQECSRKKETKISKPQPSVISPPMPEEVKEKAVEPMPSPEPEKSTADPVSPVPTERQKPKPVKPVETIDDSDDIPDELKKTFLENLMYFDDLGDDEEDGDEDNW